ncbi:hypothetical protein FRX31_016094 [Thalictrum thalictroides]|uniref:H15 domain-containing protein n=1 Tax=Thalictrum thalictroides TaxID=46969 RepID=A0A7J6WCJ5_THATH|nr:hypothetical protein FRX31_016094 [Thalictrum thalictroides]
MVLETIGVLNEKNGSSEESIMKFIDLAFDQSGSTFEEILKENVQSLIKSKEIEVTPESTYILRHYDRLKMQQSEALVAKKKSD